MMYIGEALGKRILQALSGHGKCGVAVIRVSGPHSNDVLRQIGQFRITPPPRQAILRKLKNPCTGETIDRGIVLFFPKPESFTGEDCVEFQVHGGPAVVSALLSALYQVPGCRQAEPGEFTKRAFLNDKLDLTEVEGLGDLIHAETEAQRKQALRQLEGELGTLYRKWTEILKKCLADIEAFIDFSEDQDIEETVVNQVNDRIADLTREITAHLDDNRRGERLRQGVQVVIMGEPNVGKSSLLNTICQRSAAIVTPIAGTTRDVIETAVNIGGFPVVLSDTAGLRESEDVVESEGIRRALERCHNADIKVFILDSTLVREHNIREKDYRTFIINSFQSLTGRYNSCPVRTTLSHIDLNNNETATLGGSDTFFGSLADVGPEFSSKEENSGHTPTKEDNLGHILTKEGNSRHASSKEENSSQNSSKEVKSGHTLTKEENSGHTSTKEENSGHTLKENLGHRSKQYDTSSDLNKSNLENVIIVLNKTDILTDKELWDMNLRLQQTECETMNVCPLSCLTKAGFSDFLAVLKEKVETLCGDPLLGHPSLTQERHRDQLSRCLQTLYKYKHMSDDQDIVLAAQCLRRGLRHIGSITGRVTSEDILDIIFRDFCIGK